MGPLFEDDCDLDDQPDHIVLTNLQGLDCNDWSAPDAQSNTWGPASVHRSGRDI